MRRVALTILLLSLTAAAQQQTAPSTDAPKTAPDAASQPAQSAPAPKQPVIAPTARLNAAKTVYVRKMAGNEIPFNVISNGFDGWAKYIVVFSPDKADLIVEVSAPEVEDTGFAVTSNSSYGEINNKHDQPTKTAKALTVTSIRMVVIDSHTRTPLWAGNEQPRSAARKNKSQDNLVEAAQKLFQHFHDRVEPPTP